VDSARASRTGINFFNTELAAKQLELLRELVPGAARIAVLVNPSDRSNTDATLRELAAGTIGVMEEKLVNKISVISTLRGGGKTTERLLVRISIETHKTAPDFDQMAADKAKNRIMQALGEIGCDVFIETDR
jgi:hypothetical protein